VLLRATGGRGILAKRRNRCHGLPLWREVLRSAQDAAASSLSSVNAAAAFRCARLLESAQDAAASSLSSVNAAAAFRCARLLESAQDAAASPLSSVNAAAAFRCARLLERLALRAIGA
jgi:hypothetical protein